MILGDRDSILESCLVDCFSFSPVFALISRKLKEFLGKILFSLRLFFGFLSSLVVLLSVLLIFFTSNLLFW